MATARMHAVIGNTRPISGTSLVYQVYSVDQTKLETNDCGDSEAARLGTNKNDGKVVRAIEVQQMSSFQRWHEGPYGWAGLADDTGCSCWMSPQASGT